MSRWLQIHRDHPAWALIVAWAYVRGLRVRRWVRYALRGSGRRWQVLDAAFAQARVIE